MSARDKRSPVTTHSDDEMRNKVRSEASEFGEVKPGHALAAASERFAKVLRTVPVETMKPRPREAPRVHVNEGELWATTFESNWRRHIGRIKASTIH
jgi:hypothetical protein